MSVAAESTPSWIQYRNDFLRSLDKEVEELSLPTFPKRECERKLKEKFHLEEMSISIQSRGMLAAADAVLDFGSQVLLQPLLVQPFEVGDCYFITAEQDLQQLMVVVFNDASLASYFYEKDKLLGFHYYFLAELCKLFQAVSWIPSLSVKLSGDVGFSSRGLQGEFEVVDISCKMDGVYIRFGLLIPAATFASFHQYFEGLHQEFDVKKVNPNLPLSLSVQVGSCLLTQEERSQIVPGSFILLDSCLFDPDTGESGALITVEGKQFFGGRFLSPRSGEFKITGFLNLQEEPAADAGTGQSSDPVSSDHMKLTAEVIRYTITVDEFLKLSSSSILDLQGSHPSRGVHLMINGQKVGRGEIVALGDVLGIRVLEI